MERASAAARKSRPAWATIPELAHGLRVTCQDCELHFESFIGNAQQPILLSTVPYGHPPLPFQVVVDRALLVRSLRAISRSGVAAITLEGTDQELVIWSGEGALLARLEALPMRWRVPVGVG